MTDHTSFMLLKETNPELACGSELEYGAMRCAVLSVCYGTELVYALVLSSRMLWYWASVCYGTELAYGAVRIYISFLVHHKHFESFILVPSYPTPMCSVSYLSTHLLCSVRYCYSICP
eukprot:3073441-Rhodomonas_salina.1